MKQFYYVTALALLLISLCACGGSANAENTNSESTGNFSEEMFIEASTDVIIVEMP